MKLRNAHALALTVSLTLTSNISLGAPLETESRLVAEYEASDQIKLRQALFVANACDASYLTGEQIHRSLKAMGVSSYKFIDYGAKPSKHNTQVLVASIESYTLVCFRGTQERSDWKTNLSASSVKVKVDVPGSGVSLDRAAGRGGWSP